MSRPPNAEQLEAAYIDAMAADNMRDLLANGGQLVARKAEIDVDENLVLSYFVAMPRTNNAVKMAITVRADDN